MDRPRRRALGLGVVLLLAGCGGATGGGEFGVTPAPVPTDATAPAPDERPVVELVNRRGAVVGVTVTVVTDDVDRVLVTWVDGFVSPVETGAADGPTVRHLTVEGAIRTVDPPPAAEAHRRSGAVPANGRASVSFPVTVPGSGVLVEVRPTDGSGSYVGQPEPLLAALLVTCPAGERLDTVRVDLVDRDAVVRSHGCEPAG